MNGFDSIIFAGIVIGGVLLGSASPASAQCEECITQWQGGGAEHWFGETPEDVRWDGPHSGPEGGTCSDYHSQCDQEEDDVQQALQSLAAGTFGVNELRRLSDSLGAKLIFGDAGHIQTISCRGVVTSEFAVPGEWIAAVRSRTGPVWRTNRVLTLRGLARTGPAGVAAIPAGRYLRPGTPRQEGRAAGG